MEAGEEENYGGEGKKGEKKGCVDSIEAQGDKIMNGKYHMSENDEKIEPGIPTGRTGGAFYFYSKPDHKQDVLQNNHNNAFVT